MKTYGFKRGTSWVESDYPPFDMEWQPAKRPQPFQWLRELILPAWVEWALFLASCFFCCWAIYTALKTIYPGI